MPFRTLALLCCVAALVPAVRAQEAPFSRIGVRVAGVASAVETRFHDRWETAPGPSGAVWMPFYLGDVEAGIHMHRHDAHPGQAETLPGFDARYLYLGWSVPVVEAGRLRAAPGVRLGNYAMTFDDVEVEPNGSTIWIGYDLEESEVAAAATLRLDARVTDALHVHLQGIAQRVFTSTRTDFVWLEAGLSYSIRAPRLVREVFE